VAVSAVHSYSQDALAVNNKLGHRRPRL